jgi:Cft2 family RNA processing exonuclease
LDTQFRFPRYTFAQNAESVVFGPKELVNDLPTQALVLILRSAGAKARYAVWVDEKTSRIVREAMAAPGHYMLSHNYDFNAPVKITPPIPR